MFSLVEKDLVVVGYGWPQGFTGMSLGLSKCDSFPKEMLLRYLFLYLLVFSLE